MLRRDLTVVNEIKATNTTSSDRSSHTYQTLDEKKMDVINRVKRQAKLLKESNGKHLGVEETLKMMEEAKQNCMEFIKNKKVISRFDPNRKEKLI